MAKINSKLYGDQCSNFFGGFFFVRKVPTNMKFYMGFNRHTPYLPCTQCTSVYSVQCAKEPVSTTFFLYELYLPQPRALAFWLVRVPAANTLLPTSTNSRQNSGSLYRLLHRTLEATGHCNRFNTDHIVATILLG